MLSGFFSGHIYMARILLCIYFKKWRYNIIIMMVATEV
jgi:hypothetical protein